MTPASVRACAFALAALVSAPPTIASAQESRADTLRATREEKQAAAEPPRPNLFERVLNRTESAGVPLITRDGIYIKLGTLTTGSGFAYGGGYRSRRFLDRDAGLDVWAGGSFTGYWAAQAHVQVPMAPDGRVILHAYGRRHDYPQEDYFGLGPDSSRAAQADYQLRATTVGARANAKLTSILAVGGGMEYIAPRIGDGTDDALPSIGENFDDLSAPGLSSQPDYLRSIAFVDVDWREPRNARRGGWYRLELSHYDDRDLGAYTFNRLDVDLRQFVSFFAGRRVFVGRAVASTSDTADGQVVPFYLMPTLGGNDSLRGFRTYRFRGPHALLLQGEYRFEIWSGLDAALFYDAGKVAMRRKDLDLHDLESDYGFGFRFNTDDGIILRIDTAFGSPDGTHLWIVFGGTF
jgi:hypothetical protein